MVNWQNIQSAKQIDKIIEQSKEKPVLIFKHSTSCPISSMAKFRLEGDWDFSDADVTTYYLDLLQYRPISAQIAETFSVHHESPQVLLIRDGVCTYDASHLDISVAELHECFEDTF